MWCSVDARQHLQWPTFILDHVLILCRTTNDLQDSSTHGLVNNLREITGNDDREACTR